MDSQHTNDQQFIRKLLALSDDATIIYNDIGWTSRVFLVNNGEFVVKFPRSEITKKEYVQEIAALTLLQNISTAVLLPRIVQKDPQNNFMAYKGIVGIALDTLPEKLTNSTQQVLGGNLGGFLKQLHGLTLERAPVWTLDDEIRQFQEKYAAGKSALGDLSTAQQTNVHRLVYKTLPTRLRMLGYDQALCHGDLGYWNLILANNQQIGVIDFGDIGYWDRSKDFIGLEDQPLLDAALAAYGDSPLLRQKIVERKKVLALLDLPYFVGTKNALGIKKTVARIIAAAEV